MPNLSRRSYHSPRREAAALATREAVITAAIDLFVSRGYAGTTMAGVAERAGVALATVKLVAATKGALLLEAFGFRVRSALDPDAPSQRNLWREILAQRDPNAIVRRWVALTRSAHEATAALFEVFWQAGPTDPELAKTYEEGSRSRRNEYRKVIDAIARSGGLRPGLDEHAALEIAWVLNSPLTYRQFIGSGWTPQRWERWLAELMMDQLLDPRLRESATTSQPRTIRRTRK